MFGRPPSSTFFPYTTFSRSFVVPGVGGGGDGDRLERNRRQSQADIGDEPVLVGLAGDAEPRGGHPDVAGDELVLAAAVREHDGEPPARVRGALPGELGFARGRLDDGPRER